MSDQYDTTVSTQSGWQGVYPYTSQGENPVSPQPFQHSHDASQQSQRHLGSGAAESHFRSQEKQAMSFGQHQAVDVSGSPLAGSAASLPRTVQDSQSSQYPGRTTELQSSQMPTNQGGYQGGQMIVQQQQQQLHEEEEMDMNDDDMIEEEGESASHPQTTAERLAARRKMKRFRLSHQQTRFLTSEFAKQPHPDAAHRERLSREIPGLSPRQVQVWFQNRRAKIKRLTVDDRDRMIKMRAVPEGFDNVQALHSPYGAVHGLGIPAASPVEFSNPAYSNQMMRPLMVDVRRHAGDDHLSPTGLTPAFGGIGVSQTGNVGHSDSIPPLSPKSNERYPYGNQMSSVLGGGPRESSSYGTMPLNQDQALQMGRHNMRPLQPALRDSGSTTSRSDSIPSSLRSSMSWRTDSIGYSIFQEEHSSPNIDGRNHAVYPSGHMGSPATVQFGGIDASAYPTTNAQTPTGMNYPGVEHGSPYRSRGRASSATLPLNLESREHHRLGRFGSQVQSPLFSRNAMTMPNTSKYEGSPIYTASYPPPPLTAPLNLSPPRAPPLTIREEAQGYSNSQMSAPIAAPSDFGSGLGANQSDHSRQPSVKDAMDGHGDSRDISESQNNDMSSPNSARRARSYTLPTSGAMGSMR